MDNNMLKFIKIRNSYTIPKIVELSINEKALLEYEKFCLELMNQVKKQKEVIDKAIEYINENLIISSILDGKKYYTISDYSFDYRELLDILNEATNNE